MAHGLLGWDNAFHRSTLTGGPAELLLPISNLNGVTGSPSSAWQTPAGDTSGSVIIDSGNSASQWQVFGLFRTNLTASAQVRWRVGTPASIVDPASDFDVDFRGGVTALPTGWTYTRASVATYCSGAQTLGSVASGTPRFDCDFFSGTPLGLLIEEPRTNVYPFSNFMTNNTAGGTSTIVNPSVSTLAVLASQNAAQITMSATDATAAIGSKVTLGTLTASSTYLASIYIYIPSTSAAITGATLTLTGTGMATAAQLDTVNLTLLDQWQRISARVTVGTTTTGGSLAVNTTGTAARVYFICCPQMEIVTAAEVTAANYFVTSYIPTTSATAVARVAEVATITVPSTTAMSGAADVVLNNLGGSASVVVGFNSTFQVQVGTASGSVWSTLAGSSHADGPSAALIDTATRVCWSVDGTGGYTSVDGTGGSVVSGAANTTAITTVTIGNKSGGTNYFNGRYQRLRCYPTKLSTAALDQLSGPNNSPTLGATFDTGYVSAGIIPGYMKTVTALDTAVVGQVCRCDINDPTNPDTFLNIPLAYAGPVWQPLTNIDFSSAVGRDGAIDEVVTRGGQELPVARWDRMRVELSFQGVRTSEVWPTVMQIDHYSRLTGNLIWVNDPDNGLLNYETIFGRGSPTADLTYPYGGADRRAWKFRVQERL